MVVDTSAIIAILNYESASGAIAKAIDHAPELLLSTATLLEIGIVIESRFNLATRKRFEAMLVDYRVLVVPLSTAHAEAALNAFIKYGKGRHPAALNFGDCFAYGLAKCLNQPLLFTGNDFSRTDIIPALL